VEPGQGPEPAGPTLTLGLTEGHLVKTTTPRRAAALLVTLLAAALATVALSAPAQAAAYRYWSYWQGATGTWAAPTLVQGLQNGKTSGDAGLGASLAINPVNGAPSVAAMYLDRDKKGVVTKASLFYLKLNGATWSSQLILSNSLIYRGEIVEEGPAEALFAGPRSDYGRMLLGAMPDPDPDRSPFR